jgi:hypothetical protein
MALGRPLGWLGLVDLVDRPDLDHHVDLGDQSHQPYLEHHWYRPGLVDLVDRLDQ